MYITINSCSVEPATKNKAAQVVLTGLNLEDMLLGENLREDYEPQPKTFVFSTADTKSMNYLWKVLKNVKKCSKEVNLVTKLDALVGQDIYLNSAFLSQA